MKSIINRTEGSSGSGRGRIGKRLMLKILHEYHDGNGRRISLENRSPPFSQRRNLAKNKTKQQKTRHLQQTTMTTTTLTINKIELSFYLKHAETIARFSPKKCFICTYTACLKHLLVLTKQYFCTWAIDTWKKKQHTFVRYVRLESILICWSDGSLAKASSVGRNRVILRDESSRIASKLGSNLFIPDFMKLWEMNAQW